MSDLVKDLPAEYRTPSLESLPEALQKLVVQNIRKKFGLEEPKKKPAKKAVKGPGIRNLAEVSKQLFREGVNTYISPDTFPVHPRDYILDRDIAYDSVGYTRYTVECRAYDRYGDICCKRMIEVALTEREIYYAGLGLKGLIAERAKQEMARHCPRAYEIRARV